jgi:hypothetical protein
MTTTSPPVTWDGLALNPLTERSDGVLCLIEDVAGWYDSPDYTGNDVALVLADGAVRGPKTAAARTVVLTGAAAGPPGALALFRDQLVMRAASLYPADLVIPDAAGRSMTARVRCDSDGLKHTFAGPFMFSFQVTLTAVDPRLYGAQSSVTLSNFATGSTGWTYGTAPSTAIAPPPLGAAAAWTEQLGVFAATATPPSAYGWGWSTAVSKVVTITPNWTSQTITAGDTGEVHVFLDVASAVTVTDSQGNAWLELPRATVAGLDTHVFYCPNIKALGAADTVTVTLTTGGQAVVSASCMGLKGYGLFVRAAAATGNSAQPSCAVALQTPQTALLCVMAGGGGQQPGTPPGLTSYHVTSDLTTRGSVSGGMVGRPYSTWKTTVTSAAQGSAYDSAMTLLGFATGGTVSGYQYGYAVPGGTRLSFTIPPNFGHAAIDAGDCGMLAINADRAVRLTVTDSAGNLWQEAARARSATTDQHTFVAPNARALGAGSAITVTADTPALFMTAAYGFKGSGAYSAAATAIANSTAPSATIALPIPSANIVCIVSSGQNDVSNPAGWTTFGGNSGNTQWSRLSWNTVIAALSAYPTGSNVRAYKRLYAVTSLPNNATLANAGAVPAPVIATYSGDLSASRLVDNATGNTIYLAAVPAGTSISLDTSTLSAWAGAGTSRASYVLPGSVPLLVPPLGSASWSLYATGSGSVTLTWRSAWQ